MCSNVFIIFFYRYIEKNVPQSELTSLPPFYEQQPQWFIEHTAECVAKVNEFTAENVVVNCLGRGKFLVKSPYSHIEHEVYFGNDIVRYYTSLIIIYSYLFLMYLMSNSLYI